MPKINIKVSIVKTSNKIKGYKVSCIPKKNNEIKSKRLQVPLNLLKT